MSVDINPAMSTVKPIRATSGRVTEVSELAASRYVLLLKELGAEMKYKRGWISEVAGRLEMDQGYLSRLLNLERTSIGIDLVARACANLNLKYDFFYGRAEPKSYKHFIGGHEDAPYQGWWDFRATKAGMSMSPDERLTLASIRFADGDPDSTLYEIFLLVMRRQIAPSKRDATLEENRRLRLENEEDDNSDE